MKELMIERKKHYSYSSRKQRSRSCCQDLPRAEWVLQGREREGREQHLTEGPLHQTEGEPNLQASYLKLGRREVTCKKWCFMKKNLEKIGRHV